MISNTYLHSKICMEFCYVLVMMGAVSLGALGRVGSVQVQWKGCSGAGALIPGAVGRVLSFRVQWDGCTVPDALLVLGVGNSVGS